MSSIGDKKVALNLSDGTSVNLNKPTVLDSTVTSFLGLKNGEYCGVCTYSTPEYNSDIFLSSIMDFPFPIFRKGTEATGSYNSNYYYAECPTDVNFYLKVMDLVGDDNRNTQLYALQLRGANDVPVAGEYVDFPANGWDNGLYIGRSYYDDPAPASLNDETNNESTDRVENNKIAWVLVPDQAVIKDMLPYIQDDTYHLDNNGVSISDKNSVASARVADYLADGINPRELSNGADLNKCLKVGKYGMDGITVVNGPVAVTIDGSVHYMDAANVGTNTPTTPTMNNAIMTVEMTGYVPRVANTIKLIQTIVSNEFTVRRVISGLKGTSTLDVINTAEKATTFGPWISLVEDNLTSTSTTSALSAKQGKVLNDKISNLTKSDVGLDQVDNTADANKSVKYATSAGSVEWNNVTGKPSTFAPAAHNHTKSQITDFPASLKNPTALTIQTNGTTTTYDGSAAKSVNITKASIGLGNVDNTADSAKSVKSATTASKLGSSTVGSGTKPMYLNAGVPTASSSTVGSASNPVYMKNGTITAGAYTFSASTTDLTAGTSTLATNEIRFIYE